jgi:Tfp pilus assembly protein PilW
MSPTKRRRGAGGSGGFTVMELLVGIGLGGIIVAAVAALSLYSGQNFAVLANYTDMDSVGINAMDTVSRDIRQANGLLAYSPSAITLRTDVTNQNLVYTYSSTNRNLTRKLGANAATTVLSECDSLTFSMFQRTPISGSFDQYEPGDTNEAKVIFLTWKCSRTTGGRKLATDNASTARIVMRVN